MPLASLATPGALSISPKPNMTIHTVPVNVPVMFDNNGRLEGFPYSLKTEQMLTKLATVGELPLLDAPAGLKNVSYVLELTLPCLRCEPIGEFEAWETTSQVFDSALYFSRYYSQSKNCRVHTQNLTFKTKANHSSTGYLSGYISYYNVLLDTDGSQIGIALRHRKDETGIYTAIYHRCKLCKASVTTTIAFIDNMQSIKATAIRDISRMGPEPNGWDKQYDCFFNFHLAYHRVLGGSLMR